MTYPFDKTNPLTFTVIDGVTAVDTILFRKFSDAIIRLEDELGLKPSGTYATVRARLDAMELGVNNNEGTPHSVHIATHFRHDWLSPTITTPGGPVVLPTIIGQVPIDPAVEAGYNDGYGLCYFINRFFVDEDVTFTLQLWDVTDAPAQLSTNNFTYGEHTYSTILALPLDTASERVYELRCYQVGGATSTNSVIWNSRFLFVPSTLPIGAPLSFLINTFDFNDVLSGSKSIGTITGDPTAVQAVSLIIGTEFDGATTISVGDSGDNARLMATVDNIPTILDTYINTSDEIYAAPTEINLYFTGAPSQGSGTVIVYLH
jgi:hypothetical protein